jgi:hypothetical protein
MPMKDVDMGIQDKGMLNMGVVDDIALQSDRIDYMDDGEIGYITDEDFELCKDDDCDEPMGEGMSSWGEADNEGGMGWETNESVSYMDDDYSEEDIDRLFDNTGISDDIYGMKNNEPAPTKPVTKPDTDTPAPTRPSKNPFTPPSRIKPGEEPRPKADKDVDYMAAEPRPSQEPNESPTIAPTRPDTDRPAPTRPSKNPFTPPSRIRPGEEPRPKAGKDVDYMDDEDVEFS